MPRRHTYRTAAAPSTPIMMPIEDARVVFEAAIDACERGEDIELAQAAAMRQIGRAPADLGSLIVGRIGGDGWTPDRQRAFLAHLAETASVTHACRHVGLSKQSAYQLRNRNPRSLFAIGWKVAARVGKRRLFDEAMERAMEGREVPVWHRGEQVGTRVVHNDRLIMFLLAHEPEPAHPVLSLHEMEELWPSLMDNVDAVLPPTLTPERLAEYGVDGDGNGNDWG